MTWDLDFLFFHESSGILTAPFTYLHFSHSSRIYFFYMDWQINFPTENPHVSQSRNSNSQPIWRLGIIPFHHHYRTWGSSCCGQPCDLFRPHPGFDPLCARLSPPRYLTCSWACRMSSGPWGIVVVRVSWPGYPT